MSLKISCACGKRLKVDDSTLGKRVKCPACGKAVLVEEEVEEVADEVEDEDEEKVKPRKKQRSFSEPAKVKSRKSGGRRIAFLGIGIVGWLMTIAVVAGLAVAAVVVLPMFIPSLGKQPYYEEQDMVDHLLVTIHKTKLGSIPVKIAKRSLQTNYNSSGQGIGLSGFTLPNFAREEGTTTRGGQTVTWTVECSGEAGVTQVTCDGKPVRKSPWQ